MKWNKAKQYFEKYPWFYSYFAGNGFAALCLHAHNRNPSAEQVAKAIEEDEKKFRASVETNWKAIRFQAFAKDHLGLVGCYATLTIPSVLKQRIRAFDEVSFARERSLLYWTPDISPTTFRYCFGGTDSVEKKMIEAVQEHGQEVRFIATICNTSYRSHRLDSLSFEVDTYVFEEGSEFNNTGSDWRKAAPRRRP